jgi:hypothetical protein
VIYFIACTTVGENQALGEAALRLLTTTLELSSRLAECAPPRRSTKEAASSLLRESRQLEMLLDAMYIKKVALWEDALSCLKERR